MDFNVSVLRICGAGAGAAGAGTFCREPEPEPEPSKTFCLEPEPEPEPKCFPGDGVGAGAFKNFHGSASLPVGFSRD